MPQLRSCCRLFCILPANGDLAAEHRGEWLMEGLGLPVRQSFLHLTAGGLFRRFAIGLLLAASAMVIAAAGFLLRVNLSTAGSLELLLVLLVALRLGFFPATVVSITAFLALNFLFTAP